MSLDKYDPKNVTPYEKREIPSADPDDLSAAPEPVAPENCECDNTHEQNKTVCTPCWNAGFRYETAWWRKSMAPEPVGEHSPLPWKVVPERVIVAEPERQRVTIRSKAFPHRVIVAEDFNERFAQALVDYDFIVKAVNNHQHLVDALKGLMVAYGAVDGRNGNSGECWDAARAALAAVEGQP